MNRNKNIFFCLLMISFMISCGKNIEDSKKPKTSPRPADKTSNQEAHELKILNERKEKLYNAIMADSPGMVKTELDANDNVSFFFDDGNTPLTLALKYSFQNESVISSMIIEKSSDKSIVNTKNSQGEFPLYLATQSNNLYVLNILLKTKIKIDQKMPNGSTALTKALENNNTKFANRLLIHGADIHSQTSSGLSAIELAAWFNYDSILNLMNKIKQHSQVDLANLMKAIKTGDKDFVRYLFTTHKAYQEFFKTNNIFNIIIDLNDQSRESILNTVLRFGKADVNINDGTNQPPLIYATIKKQLKTIKRLLANGASVLIKDSSGKTALDLAVNGLDYLTVNLLHQKLKTVTQNQKELFDEVVYNACMNIPTRNQIYNTRIIDGHGLAHAISNILECNQFRN